ncbi:glycosyltransferase family 4 protein [Echinicola soli]|uniref:Glycosyltransferase family 4 protein n=1 Tax=Echinicola soli TaxID=2591634 RepID=A0A514CJW5_9BACT|nr:glycosyltransferase family 4 protein [Echinicola soli]QDH80088.1 glycosyltransferase family 4 protein [Echinicola soli]
MRKSNQIDNTITEGTGDGNYAIEFSKNKNSAAYPTEKAIKVLFVSSGNLKNFDLAPFIKVQGESLVQVGINVTYFKVKGKGSKGYINNIENLRNFIKNNHFDLIHAHFTLSGWVAALSFPKQPLILSLMGTDALGRVKSQWKIAKVFNYLTMLTYLIQPFVKKIIAKSPNIDRHVWIKSKSHILPNGVDLSKFDGKRTDYSEDLNLDHDKKYILFLGKRDDKNKNFQFLKEIESDLAKLNFQLIAPYPVSHPTIIKYLSTVEMVVVCSLQEGSPNVVKEAMASNCKGVFTDVGDIREVVGNTPGYAITSFKKEDLLDNILKVDAMTVCKGRERLIEKKLDTKNIALKLKAIYLDALNI